ncbi:MAG: hypothetical protein ACREGC_04255, partial [Minisyncoccia bacterium]
MQRVAQKAMVSEDKKYLKKFRKYIPVSVFFVSIVLALVAIFAMNNWVELSETHHAVQHVLIFLA